MKTGDVIYTDVLRLKASDSPDPFLKKIDRYILDDPTWAKLMQLEAIRTALFSAKAHERIGKLDVEAKIQEN